ncbi:hypothetical protein IFR05_015050 [Cadophora sp. M221]|nr:hypothetical protein IFR05_015050 [Cadophora sp. M221]
MSESHTALPKSRVSHMGYFRRSRDGCVTCRTGRLKCDEAKPSCTNCTRRNIQCEGYPKKFRWIQNPDVQMHKCSTSKNLSVNIQTATTLDQSQLGKNRTPNKSQIDHDQSIQCRNISTLPLHLHGTLSLLPDATELDRYLFDYDLFQMSKLVFVSSDPLTSARSDHVALALEPNSLLFDSIMASSAIHLNLSGLVDRQIVFSKKNRALRGMRVALAGRESPDELTCINGFASPTPSFPRRPLNDMIICASMSLIGRELSQGSHLSQILPLIKGSTTLIMERYQIPTHGTTSTLPPIFLHCQRLVAYFDILSCIPYPRAPFLDTEVWFPLISDSGRDRDYDPLMGCFSEIFAMIGKAASLISGFYERRIDEVEFLTQQNLLISQLQAWEPFQNSQNKYMADKPPTLEGDDYISAQAGNAHKFATLIYLLRSYSKGGASASSDDTHHRHLVSRLRSSVSSVPIDSPFTATMLWPAFVLGCESLDSHERDQTTRWFLEVLAKQRFENIRVALDALREEIWRSGDSARRLGWVQVCWEKKIKLILA